MYKGGYFFVDTVYIWPVCPEVAYHANGFSHNMEQMFHSSTYKSIKNVFHHLNGSDFSCGQSFHFSQRKMTSWSTCRYHRESHSCHVRYVRCMHMHKATANNIGKLYVNKWMTDTGVYRAQNQMCRQPIPKSNP